MPSWWKIIVVFFLSTFKFVFGAVPVALAAGFSFFETVTITSFGGIIGCTLFVLLSEKIVARIKKRREEKCKEGKIGGKKFTKKNKLIVKVKMKFGLTGIAFLTPFILSIPIGCFLAVRYFKSKQKILMYMYTSILFWSVSIASLKFLFNVSF